MSVKVLCCKNFMFCKQWLGGFLSREFRSKVLRVTWPRSSTYHEFVNVCAHVCIVNVCAHIFKLPDHSLGLWLPGWETPDPMILKTVINLRNVDSFVVNDHIFLWTSFSIDVTLMTPN